MQLQPHSAAALAEYKQLAGQLSGLFESMQSETESTQHQQSWAEVDILTLTALPPVALSVSS